MFHGKHSPFSYTNTLWTRAIYTAVPAPMLNREFPFRQWSITITAMDISSGSPWEAADTWTSFRQYTTNRPMVAYGSVFPRYSTYLGMFFPAGNRKNGRNRVIKVAPANAPAMQILFTISLSNFLYLPFGFPLVSNAQYAQNHDHRRNNKCVSPKKEHADH